MIEVVLLSVVFMFIAFAFFGIRMLFVKKGEFRGTCASNNPYLQKDGIACGVCGAKPGENCAKEEPESVNAQSRA